MITVFIFHSPGSICNHPEDVPLQLSLYTGQRFILTKQTHSYTKHFLYTKKMRKKKKFIKSSDSSI